MPYTTTLVANNILNRAFAERHELCKDKLQIILYFVASEYHKETGGKPLFPECFETCTRNSPSLQSVEYAFHSYRNKPITRFARNANGKTRMINEDADPVLCRVLNRVWQATKERNVDFLYTLGRREGSAWLKAFKNNQEFISDYDITMDTSYCSGLGLKRPQLK